MPDEPKTRRSNPAEWKWQQLAQVGTFKGHPAGPFALTPAVFDEIVRNFDRDGLPIAVDMEHASEADATSGSIPVLGAPAQGWAHKLENRGAGGLWGLVEWLEPLKTYIREGKYAFVSPAIRFNSRDRVTGAPIGARLTSVAATNQPFLKSMQPLAAKDKPSAEHSSQQLALLSASALAHHPDEYMGRVKETLKLHPLSSATECADHLEKLRDHFDASGGDPAASHEGVQLGDYMRPLRDLSGVGMGATWDDVFDVVEEMIRAAIEEHVLEDHGGSAEAMSDGADEGGAMKDHPPPAAPVATVTTEEKETAMADDAAKLKDLETKTAQLDVEKQTLGLQLKDAEGKLSEKDRVIAAKDAEIVSLKEAGAKRDEADRNARVELAFGTWKDKRNLSDADKEAMTLVLSSNPALFEKLYPRIDASHQHLLTDLTKERPAAPPVIGNGAPVRLSLRDLARQIAAKTGCSIEAAQLRAIELQNSAA